MKIEKNCTLIFSNSAPIAKVNNVD